MKTETQIHNDIINRFEESVQDSVARNSAIDLFTAALAQEYSELYEEIENNKTPHVWTKLEGVFLDMAGAGLNCPRQLNESDATYKYRLLNWVASLEKSNTTAIDTSILNLEYGSYAKYVPFTRGAGTGTLYIIPKHYNEETIVAAVEEIQKRIQDVIDPGTYIEYIIPTIIGVRLQSNMEVDNSDVNLLRSNLEETIMEYINNIPPNDFLEIGKINKIGINEPGVKYFNVLGLYLNDLATTQTSILQGIETKMLYDEIIWIGDE